MKKLLFIPIFFLMLNIASAENLEITEVKMVADIIIDSQAWLDTQTIGLDIESQQAIVDFIGDEIIEKKYNIDTFGVMMVANPMTLEPTHVLIILDLVFDEYIHKLDIKNVKGD